MTRGADVPDVMARVAATLADAGRSPGGARGVLELAPEGDREVNVSRARHLADIDIEVPSGSDRPLVGGGIRLAKRALRRTLRWYVEPIMQQQSRFNHATLDVLERLRLRVASLGPAMTEAGEAEPAPGQYPPLATRVARYERWLAGRGHVICIGDDGTELLRVLTARGVPAYGVALDQATVEAGRARGLALVVDDPVEHLRRQEPGVLDGVVCSLLIDPPPARDQVELLLAAATALGPSATVVVETLASPGPPGSRPRPLHPEAIQAALQATGFADTRIEVIAPAAHSSAPAPGGQSLAAEIERLDDLLTRHPVSAVVATRPGPRG